MNRKNWMRSPLVPKKITEHVVGIFYGYISISFFSIFFMPESVHKYPYIFVKLANILSIYIPVIKVLSVDSFNPVIALFYGSAVYLSTIILSALFFIMSISGCNATTCMALNDEFPEYMAIGNYRLLAISIGIALTFSFFFVIPNFSWYPKNLPFGFFSGAGISYSDLIKSVGGDKYNLVQLVILEVYYSKLILAVFYLLISISWLLFSLLFGVSCRTFYCKLTNINRK